MHVYFLGIAGAGMSALASLLASRGVQVSGSDDDAFPPVTTYLERLGIPYHLGFDAAQVPDDVDAAVIGSSAKLDLPHNPELAELQRRGVRLQSFADLLGALTTERETIVVAGSFGKSTVSALLAHLLRAGGRDPGWFVGAVPLDLPATGFWGSDPTLVVEGDEYVVSPDDRRSKFLLYEAQALIITSLVHDHVNVFPTMARYEAPFATLVERLPGDAPLVCARGYEPLDRIARSREAVWYGLGDGSGYCGMDIRIGEVTRFDLALPSGRRVPVATELLGLHNIENIVGAAALLLEQGLLSADQIAEGAASFHGVARRLDRKTRTSRVPVYEGFGSSYEKARSAIEAVRLHFPRRRLFVVFEPHAFSWRNAEALAWYDTVFEGVAEVVLMPPPDHGAEGHAQLDQRAIATRISAAGVSCRAAAGAAEAQALIESAIAEDCVVLLLSSGPLGGLAQTLPPRLDALWS
ncbi:MAG TPA: Mur ligase domain-containing protein [Caulobacteraceae bacterium]|nr:Mur ligase domain-containing protein [Caulobacteraceae bacterium]